MQHSGAPTRLLDWTEGSLIALYIAVRNKVEQNTDAAVWALDPWEMNNSVLGLNEVIAPGAEASLLHDAAAPYKSWLPARYEQVEALSQTLPIAVYPTHFARRINSQRSCFTIHGSSRDGFSRLPQRAAARLAKIIIPGPATREIDRGLSVCGIDEITIFPDLDGLGRWLSMVLRDES
jgi:hypothetical protein